MSIMIKEFKDKLDFYISLLRDIDVINNKTSLEEQKDAINFYFCQEIPLIDIIDYYEVVDIDAKINYKNIGLHE